MRMEVDRISYIFGSFTRRRQSQEIGSAKRRSVEQKICHDRSNSTPHTTKKSEPQAPRAKSVYGIPFDESKYKCPLCQRVFVEPRVLPCLHTFCIRCLQELEANDSSWSDDSNGSLNGSGESAPGSGSAGSGYVSDKQNSWSSTPPKSRKGLTCPTCGTRSDVPHGGVSAFPLNYLMQHRLVLATLNANASRLLCDLCPSDVPAAYRCTQCATSLCSHCSDAHRRQKGLVHHEVLTLEEAKRKGITRVRRQIMCTDHPEQELTIFCSTCYQVICKECILTAHRDHTYDTASQAAKLFITNLRMAVDKAKMAAERSAITLARLQAASKRVETHCNKVQAEVERFIEDYVRAVDQHRVNLYAQITQTREVNLQRIEEQREDLQKGMKGARDVAAFIDELLNEGTDVEVLSFAKPVLKKLESCTEDKVQELKMSESLQFLPEEAVPSSGHCYPLYGVITTQTVSAKHCLLNAEGYSNIRVGKKVELTLETCDKNGTPLERGGERVSAEFILRDAGIPRGLPTHITDLRNGKYLISFTPDTIGKFLLNVYVKGQPIKSSPFPITVRALKPHQGTFHCCSFCSSNGSKEATCGCGGKMPGGYKGCGHGHEGHPGKRHWSCCGSVMEHSECIKMNSTHYQFTL